MEIWKPIAGYEGRYEVSNYGRVRSLDCGRPSVSKLGLRYERLHRGRVLKPIRCGDGYRRVALMPHVKVQLVHRLVAAAFLPNPLGLPEVNHLDGVRDRNCVSNLMWVTASENQFHANRELPRKRSFRERRVKVTIDPTRSITFPCCKRAAEYLETLNTTVHCAARNGWRVKGHKVEFVA